MLVSVFNMKGGVGKTTTAINLGAALAENGNTVVLVDLDGQRTLSYALRVDDKKQDITDFLEGTMDEPIPSYDIPRLSVIPGSINCFRLPPDTDLESAVERLKGWDYVIFDCPPGVGVASGKALLASDRVLMPTLNEAASLRALSEAIHIIRRSNSNIAIDVLRCFYKGGLVLTSRIDSLLEEGQKTLDYSLLETKIPQSVAASEAIGHGMPVLQYAPMSSGAVAYRLLAKEVRKWKE